MMPCVRQVEGTKVLRLFPTEKDAHDTIKVITSKAVQHFKVTQHKSKNGWLILETISGRRIDVAGILQ